jgi:ferric-dicitrate binding protein FerR (iron transport regulator)
MKTKYLALIFILALSFFLFSLSKRNETVAGKLIFRLGNVTVKKTNSDQKKMIRINSTVHLNEIIETKSQSRCEIELLDGSILRVNQNTMLKLDKSYLKSQEKRTSIDLIFGSLWITVKKLISPTDEFSVKTPVAVAAVRGTDFKMELKKDNTLKIMVDEGTVDCGEAPMLRNFDSFADWLKNNEEAFNAWANKNNGEDFYTNELKAFQEFEQQDQDEFDAFLRGEKTSDKKPEWVKTLEAGEKIIINSDGSFEKSKIDKKDEIKGW